MEKNQKAQIERSKNLLNIALKLKDSVEELNLASEGYGDENSFEEKIKRIRKNSKDLLTLLDIIESVSKNGEDQYKIFSC